MNSLDILSLFPDAVQGILDSSILRRAQLKERVSLSSIDLRSYARDKHKTVDASPYGGEQGMLFKADVLELAYQDLLSQVSGRREDLKIIYPSPRGIQLKQEVLWQLSHWLAGDRKTHESRKIGIFCGRYEGVDERWIEKNVDLEISLGDFILSGGELVALSVLDGIVRLVPGVLGDQRSNQEESFQNGLLEYPQYTRPREFEDMSVPEELMSGHHQKIKHWKLKESLLMTAAFRPDLILAHDGEGLEDWALELLGKLKKRCAYKVEEASSI